MIKHMNLTTYKFICNRKSTFDMAKRRKKHINIEITEVVHHWPTLKTILMVEDALKNAETALSIEGLKRKLPRKIMDQTLRIILAYLESKGSILVGERGIVWIENNDPKFIKLIEKSKEIEL